MIIFKVCVDNKNPTHGTTAQKKGLVVAKGDNAVKAKEAGADFVGYMAILKKIHYELNPKSWTVYK